MDAQRRNWLLATGVTALALISIALPVIAPAVFLAVFIAFVVTERVQRKVTLLVAAPLMMAGFVRFLMFYAVPNIVIAGQVAAEKAVNRLREIKWAEQQAKQIKGHYVSLRDLVGDKALGNGTGLLNEHTFKSVGDASAFYRADAYLLTVAPASAGGAFVAYAWPAGESHGGQRSFAIDQDDRICESSSPRYRSVEASPAGSFASSIAAPCGIPSATDWRAWRNKKPAPPAR